MRTLALGNPDRNPHRNADCTPVGHPATVAHRRTGMSAPARRMAQRGFTLLELLVVVSIVALATAGVSLSLRDTAAAQLEREAQRLAALLESTRAQSRTMGVPLYWRATPQGFELAGQFRAWLTPGTQATLAARDADTPPRLVLGPEPLLPPQEMALTLQGRTLWLHSDGLRPFQVGSQPGGAAP